VTDKKCHWIRQLGSAYYHFCKDSTKKNTPVYELQHQMMEHSCIQTALHLGSRSIVWRRHCAQRALSVWEILLFVWLHCVSVFCAVSEMS